MGMLGYETSDLDMMIAYTNIASKELDKVGKGGLALGLQDVSSFLHGLYAEGYFSNEN